MIGRMVRWVNDENARMLSTSSPNSSRRAGRSAVEGYTSRMPPRTDRSPRSSTWCTRS